MPGSKKTTKRKVIRRSKGKSRNIYFSKDTHASINKYQEIPDENIREKHTVFVKEILPAFTKLVENLIAVYGFGKFLPDMDKQNLKHDCVSFLYESIHKFDDSKGAKAFSYFNVVAKNWLIIKSKKAQKEFMRNVRIDDPNNSVQINADSDLFNNDSKSQGHRMRIDDRAIDPMQDHAMVHDDRKRELKRLMVAIMGNLKNENDKKCMDGIMQIFDTVDDIDFLNKRALFVYIREMTGLNPKSLSISMSTIRKHYRELVATGKYDIH